MAGGFDAKFVFLPGRLTCPVCFVGMKDPLLTVCGHRFCDACVKPLRKENGAFTCPVCREALGPISVFPDNAVKREVLGLKVKCDLVEEGCKWRGELRELGNHFVKCEFVTAFLVRYLAVLKSCVKI
ncbi:TNF receptor-associated factor 4-like [Oscarella lobularis]|uniref:TNF receptor-associated factor 4-like n=1 Tax=Oscarella lobularis TaxID=121494 RepID=UPI00331358C7